MDRITIKRGATLRFFVDFDLSAEEIIKTFSGATAKAAIRPANRAASSMLLNTAVDAANQRIICELPAAKTEMLAIGLHIVDIRVASAAGEVDYSKDIEINVVRETTNA
ncbi:hypothetical protein PL75_03130 [Neisseria arctica]|uniref:Uncharacterized protein n=1 Tax=Neisseria arctica TaxID=1470200 RepID=A0A0J0YSV9_9NEIS|nr:hypothetical protein [Neisseria arctica]KLT73240.1 hypothetical protein PL75_03130 [Neisseria arctica]UOO87513.1 hypothetical protein LVJ86_04510 [Neisseria arctica]